MTTLKQRERIVANAVKKLDAAADAMLELTGIASEFGVKDLRLEERFGAELRERARYWENCRWWKK